MAEWFAGFLDMALFWKFVVMAVIVCIVSFINGWRKAGGEPPLWPPQPPRPGPDRSSAEASLPMALPDDREHQRADR
ncbi:MAG: hypothetical protein U1F67_15560 [Rubrivivax sp.]